MTPNNSDGRTIACVVDTECCYKNAKPYDEANGLVYHFGAVFGDMDFGGSFWKAERRQKREG